MKGISGEECTVMFVSHNMVAIQSICSRAVWFFDGNIKEEDRLVQAIFNYLHSDASLQTEQFWDDVVTLPGNDKVCLYRVCIKPQNGSTSDSITMRTPFVMESEYRNLEPNSYLNLSLHLYNEQGIMAYNTVPALSRCGTANFSLEVFSLVVIFSR